MVSSDQGTAGAPQHGFESHEPSRHNDSSRSQKKKKRKRRDSTSDNLLGMGSTLSLLRQPDLPAFNLTDANRCSPEPRPAAPEPAVSAPEWQTVEHASKKQKKIPKAHSSNYPSITFSTDSRLQSQIKISDLQNLVLYLLADGTAPQWVSVRHRPQIRKVVVLMVPGLEKNTFGWGDKRETSDGNADADRQGERTDYRPDNPDTYYPRKLATEKLASAVQPFANMFEHIWPVKTPGDDKYYRMHSPLHAMLTAPMSTRSEEKKKGAKPAREPQGWRNTRTVVTEYISSAEELMENEYTLHPAMYDNEQEKAGLQALRRSNGTSTDDGWVNTKIGSFADGTPSDGEIEQGSLTAGREVIAMDCEMCMTGSKEFSLTRISLVRWDGTVLLDELVKPDKPIIDYVTQ